MTEAPPGLRQGLAVQCVLADGTVFTGTVDRVAKGWVRLLDAAGPVLVHLAHVAVIKPGDAAAAGLGLGSADADEVKARGRGSPAAADDWSQAQLRALADGILDGHTDAELAARLGQRRGQVATLRQAFECARGNLVEEEIPPAARAWIARWRAVLAS